MTTRQAVDRWVLPGGLVLFAVAAVSISGGGSTLYYGLVALGLILGWPGLKRISDREKLILGGLGVLLLLAAVSLLKSEDIEGGFRKFDRFLRFALFVPAFLLMRRGGQPCGRFLLAGFLAAAPVVLFQGIYQTRWPIHRLDLSGGIPEDRSGQDALQAIRAEFDTNGIELGRDAQRIPGPERESWLIKDGVRRYLLTPKPGGFRVDELPLVRAKGAYHEIIYGDFCVHVMSVLGAWMIAVAGRPLDYAAGASGLLMAFYASLLSGTRGAWLSIPFLALLALLLYARRLRRCHWALLGTAILLAAALALILLPNVVLARFANLKNAFSAPSQVASLHERLEMWRGCLLILRDSPLLGTGLGDLKADMQRLIDRKSVDLPGATDHAHSIYFDALARMGLLGFAALVAFAFVLPFWTFFRGWRQQASPWAEFHALAGMFTVAAFALFGLTEAWFSRMPLVTTYVISLMTFLAGMANEMERRPDGVRPDED